MNQKTTTCLALLFMAGGLLAADTFAPPPAPKPLHQNLGFGKKVPELRAMRYSQDGEDHVQPSLAMGNKSVDVGYTSHGFDKDCEASVSLRYGDKSEQAFGLYWFGVDPTSKEHGWPFRALSADEAKGRGSKPAALATDPKTQCITYSRPYLAEDGAVAYFTYSLKPLDTGRVELEWSSGSKHPVQLVVRNMNTALGKNIAIGGIKLDQSNDEALTSGRGGLVVFRQGGDFEYESGNPAKSFKVSGLGNSEGRLNEPANLVRKSGGFVAADYWNAGGTTGKVVIDLGESEFFSGAAPNAPLNGLDFWKDAGIDMPLPATRNELRNPGFEQGFQYWTYGSGEYVPTDTPYFELTGDALFGKKALIVRNPKFGADTARHVRTGALVSMPTQLLPGETYTASFHAKALDGKKGTVELYLTSSGKNGKVEPLGDKTNGAFAVGPDWSRHSLTFKAGAAGFRLNLSALKSSIVVDGLQVERGTQPTAFVHDPIEAELTTSAPDNDVDYGKPVDLGFVFHGQGGTKAKVDVSIVNFFHETVHEESFALEIGADGLAKRKLSPEVEQLGKGVFVVKISYDIAGGVPYHRFARYTVMTPLENKHDTAKLVGTLMNNLGCICRGDEFGKKLKRWGFGSTSWGRPSPKGKPSAYWRILKENGIVNLQYALADQVAVDYLEEKDFPERADALRKIKKHQLGNKYLAETPLSPKQEKILEEACYQYMKDKDPESCLAVSWNNEEEMTALPGEGRFDDYFKWQRAAVQGAKRADPKFQGTYSSGVSSIVSQKVQTVDGYLGAAERAGFKYDAVPVHTYGHLDGSELGQLDLDKQLSAILDVMKKHGYGEKTPLYLTECANERIVWLPEWNTLNGDTYNAGLPEYSWGQYEFLNAACMTRLWLIALKYWPKLVSTNIWQSYPYMDYNFTPIFTAKAANSFGNLFPHAEHIGDIRPAPGVRGYCYRLPDGSAIAAVWCVDIPVERSKKENPKLRVKFGQDVAFVDMMENPRSVAPGADGVSEFALTPAPLYVKAKDPEKLLKDLQGAELRSSSAEVNVTFGPAENGDALLILKNLVGREQQGTVKIGDVAMPFQLAPLEEKRIPLPGMNQGDAYGRLYRKALTYTVKTERQTFGGEWDMTYLFVPKCSASPDWKSVPSFPIANPDMSANSAPVSFAPKDFSASYQLAWNDDALFVRVTVVDDKFRPDTALFKNSILKRCLWEADGCLEFYLDCFANGRSSELKGMYDSDDYRYDFAFNPDTVDGRCGVTRLHNVDIQMVDGVTSPDAKELDEKLDAQFQRTADGYVYTLKLGKRYIAPTQLKPGWLGGVAFYLHDHDSLDKAEKWKIHKGISSGLNPGKHCQNESQFWPLMILK